MRVLIVGGGRIGFFLAEELAAKGHEVSLIEKRSDRAQELVRRLAGTNVRVILGDGNDPTVLRDAGAMESHALAAVTGEDEDNLVVGLLGKREFGIARVVGRVNNPRNGWLYSPSFGFDASVRPAETIVTLIEEQIEQPAG